MECHPHRREEECRAERDIYATAGPAADSGQLSAEHRRSGLCLWRLGHPQQLSPTCPRAAGISSMRFREPALVSGSAATTHSLLEADVKCLAGQHPCVRVAQLPFQQACRRCKGACYVLCRCHHTSHRVHRCTSPRVMGWWASRRRCPWGPMAEGTSISSAPLHLLSTMLSRS